MIALIFAMITSMTSFSSEQNRGWLGVFSRKANESNTHFSHQEVQLRYDFENGSNQQLLVRFGLLKPISETQEIGFLMGYIETGALVEYRPTLQHVFKAQTSRGGWSLRSRLEWRHWEDRNTNSIRSRFQLSYLHKLDNLNSFVIWDEPFLNFTHDSISGQRFFERNRAFVGLRLPILGHQMEIGYLNQIIPRNQNLTEHIAVTYIYF